VLQVVDLVDFLNLLHTAASVAAPPIASVY